MTRLALGLAAGIAAAVLGTAPALADPGNTATNSTGTVQVGSVSASPTATVDSADIAASATAPVAVGSGGGNSANGSTGTVQAGGGNSADGSTGTRDTHHLAHHETSLRDELQGEHRESVVERGIRKW